MNHFLQSRTFSYVVLCLFGLIVLLIALLAEFQGLTYWFLTVIGVVMTATGGVYLIDSVILRQDGEVASLKWRIYSNIAGVLKAITFQIAMFVMALCYIAILTKIFVVLFPGRW